MYRVSLMPDVPVIVGASLAIVVPSAFAGQLITPRCPCSPSEVNAFDRPAIGNASPIADSLSDVTVGAAVVLPLVLNAVDLGFSEPLLEDSVVFAETLAVNGALTTAAKYIVQRPLPRTYAGDAKLIGSPRGYRSFYSGHTSLAFAALSATSMTLRLRYGEKYWPWVITLLVGSSVAIERVVAGRHFPTDVLVGAVMGTATGIVVPWLHARTGPRVNGLVLVPMANGLQVGWTKQF